jgi:ABC-2 type transport system permease protein
MKPMINWEVRRRRMFIIGWTLGIVAMIALTVLSYGSVRDQADELNKAMGEFSSSIGSFVGTTDMFSPIGYMNSQLYFITLPILFIILCITLVNGLIGKEESHGTIELLLSRPISRIRLLGAKALSGVAVLAVIGGVTALVTILSAQAADMRLSAGNLLLATFGCIVFAGAFGAITFMLLAASVTTRRMAFVAAISLSLGSYLLTSLAGLVSWLAWPAKLLPYHYYDTNALLNGRVPLGFVLYIGGIYLLAIVVSIVGFRRRDIN